MYQIVRRHQFSDSTFLWDVYAPDVARAAEPGHFVMLRLREGGERIPLTVADYDRDWGTVTIVIQAIGKPMFFGQHTDTLDWRMPELTAFYSILAGEWPHVRQGLRRRIDGASTSS